MTRVRPKKAVELPAPVREFVDTVTNTPFDAIAEVLEGFTWNFEKGDFHHWATLFNYFDDLLDQNVSPRKDLTLEFDRDGIDSFFPSRNVLAILRVTAIILENCSNKHLYHSYEHLTMLLAAPDPAVITATLHTLVQFVRKTHASSVRWHGWPDLNSRLLALSQGWGGKEEGLDLAACTQSDEGPIKSIMSLGTTLNFQFYLDASDAGNGSREATETTGLQVINLQHVDHYHESVHDILHQLVKRFSVPEKLRFPLLTRIVVASNFSSLEGRRHLARLRLLSLYILFQCSPSPEAVAEFYVQEPEFVSDLVGLLVAGNAVPEDLRILALRVLAVQLLDRTHHTAVIAAISSGGQSGLLSMLMHRSILSVAGAAATGGGPAYSVEFVDALLSLVGSLSASTSGCSALTEAGTLSALMPLLKDADPAHVGLVASAVRILEAYMDFSPNSASQFREMGGLTNMIERLRTEVGLLPSPPAAGPDDMQTDAPAPAAAATEPPQQLGEAQSAAGDAAQNPAKPISYQHRVLLKALLRTIAITSYAPGSSTRPQEEDSAALHACLRRIFERSAEFGGGLFSLASSIMTDQLHHEPLSFAALEKAGLPQTFLDAIKRGVIPSGEAVCAVPSTLVALCLNEKGLELVKQSKALDCFVPIFTTPTYLRALQFQGDTPSALGSSFDELMRHVNSLREDTVEMVLTIFRTLCKLGGQAEGTSSQQEEAGPSASAQPMDMDESTPPADAAAQATDMDMSGNAGSPKAPADRSKEWHPHLTECITHSARLLETMLSNQSFSRQFVDKAGLQLLLKLYTLKHLPSTFGSSSASHALMAAFRICTQLHGTLVTSEIATAMAEHLRTTLLLAMSIGRSSLQGMDVKRREEYTRSVSSLEGITSLASAVARTTPSMLNEVSKAGRFPGLKTLVLDEPVPDRALAVENVPPASAIIARIGDLERIIHLQVALTEHTKAELDKDAVQQEAAAASSAEGAQQPGPSSRLPVAGRDFDPMELAAAGLSVRAQQQILRDIAVRVRQGRPVPANPLLLADQREGLIEEGDPIDPPASSSPREEAGGHKNGRKKPGEDLAMEVLTHFAATVRGFYASLTKSIHTPLRRREEGLAMTPAIRSTALHLGLVMKMNFEGVGIRHWDGASSDPAQGSEAASSSSSSGGALPQATVNEWSRWKARYLSAMVDDLASILFDNRRGTCHCLMLNYWVRCGGLQVFLAQFGTAAQFLWDVAAEEAGLASAPAASTQIQASTSASADEAKLAAEVKKKRLGKVRERAEMLLSSMLALLNQLADSTRILSSPLATTLLTVPLNDEDQETNAAWSSAENLVKSLKSAILDAVLPVWGSPHLASCSPQNTAAVTSILKHCTEAVSTPTARTGPRGVPPPDPAIVQQVVEMGFSEERVREALRRVGYNSVELAMEWLINHPEEVMETESAAAPPLNDQVPGVAKAINLAPAQALLKPKNEAPSTEQLVDGAVSVLKKVPNAAFSLADLLKSHSAQQAHKEDGAVMAQLLQRLHSGESFADTVRSCPAASLLAPAHLLALLCDEDPAMRNAGAKEGLTSTALGLLEAWVAAHATRLSALKGLSETDVEPIPRWVDALLLVLNSCTHIDWQAPSADAASKGPQAGATTSAAPQAEQGMEVDSPPAAGEPSASAAAAPAAEQCQPSSGAAAPAATAASAAEPKPVIEDVFKKLPRHEAFLPEEGQDRAVKIAMALLRHLHAWGTTYQEPAMPSTEQSALQQPDPPSSAQSVLLLLSCLTKRHSVALKVLAGKGPKLILELPLACFSPDLEPYISAIMRHILEDPATLQAAMEAEIRSTLSKGRVPKPSGYPSGSAQGDGCMPVRQFLQTCAAVINREPTVFFEAVLATCTIRENNGRTLVVLKKAKGDNGTKPADDKKNGESSGGGGPPDPSSSGAAGRSGASAPSATTPAPQGNPAGSSSAAGPSGAGATPAPSGGGGTPLNRRESGSHRRPGGHGTGGGAPGGPPGGGPGGGGGGGSGGGGGGKTPRDKDKGRGGKKVPSSFVEVIDTLVDLVLRYEGPNSKSMDAATGRSAMETDTTAAAPSAAAEPSTAATSTESQPTEGQPSASGPQPNDPSQSQQVKQGLKQEERDMVVQCIALKMLTDFTLMYNSCVGVLLKRDSDGTRGRGSSPPATPAAKSDSPVQGLLFRQVMHRHLVYIPEPNVGVQGLAEQASFFLMAVCIRSAEGRKRIISEIVNTLLGNLSQKPPAPLATPSPAVLAAIPLKERAGFPPPYKVKAFVELAGSLMSAGAKSQSGQPTGLPGEMMRCMRQAGVINALICALKMIDMDHPNAVKSISSILKPLEILTRALPALAVPRQPRDVGRLFDRTAAGSGAREATEPDGVEQALAALGGPSSVDERMRDAQEDSAAAGPEAVAAAERLRQAFERDQSGDVEGLARSVESVMEQIIEHAYGDESIDFEESDSEGDGTDEDLIESDEDDAMGEEPMPDMTDEEDEDVEDEGAEDDEEDDDDDDIDPHHHHRHHRHHHHDADHSVYSSDDDSSSDDDVDEDHEVEVMFDDIEEDALVGPLLEDEQLMMGHGGGEGSSEDVDDADVVHNPGDDGEDHGDYDDEDEDGDDEDEDGEGDDVEEFDGIDDLHGNDDHEFMLGEDEDGLLGWPDEDGFMDEAFQGGAHTPRWVGIPRMNGHHNLTRAGAAAQHSAVEMMVNQLLNTGALGGIQVGDARENRFRYRMRAGQQQNGGPSTAGIPGAAMGPRHRLLQRPTPVAGTGRSGDEARAAHEMRILRMNQPFPGIFNPEEAGNAGEYWMITADHPRGLSAGAGPRSFVLQTPNAGSLIDFSAEMIRAPGGNARMSNWSDDGQPPSIVESTLLAGQLEQSLVETLRQHAAPGDMDEPPAREEPNEQNQQIYNEIADRRQRAGAPPMEERVRNIIADISDFGDFEGALQQLRANQDASFMDITRTQSQANRRGDLRGSRNSAAPAAERGQSAGLPSEVDSAVAPTGTQQRLHEGASSEATPTTPAERSGRPHPPSGTPAEQQPRTLEDSRTTPAGEGSAHPQHQDEAERHLRRVSFEERIADLPALPTPIWPPGREPLTTFRATFSMLELLHARIRALEAIPEAQRTANHQARLQAARSAWDRQVIAFSQNEAALPISAEALSDAQVEGIRQSLRERVAGRLRESGSEAAAAQFERFVADFDPRNVTQVPDNMQAMIAEVENAARVAAPAAGGPSNATPSEFNHPAAAAIPEDWSALLDRNREPTLAGAPPPLDVPPPENLLQALHEEMEALTPEQRAGQLRVLEELRTEAQALIAARETARQRTPAQPAAGSSSRAPPAPPRRTRYQARLRSAQDTAERDLTRSRRGVRPLPQPNLSGVPSTLAPPATSAPPPVALGAINADMFSSALSAAMSGLTGAQPGASRPVRQPSAASNQAEASATPPLIGADLLSAALSGVTAAPSTQDAMARGDVEMTDAEPPAAASSTPASGLPPGLAAAFEDTGVNPDVFQSMPPSLQQEVLRPASAAAAPSGAPAESSAPVPMETQDAAAQPESSAAAVAGEAGTRGVAAAPAGDSDDEMAGIDPDFLAALPEELQAEVLEAHRRERRQRRAEAERAAAAQAAAAAGEGGGGAGPQELDLATTLASFPPDVRDEVLMTADEEMLSQLPPAILAEAQALRERALAGRPRIPPHHLAAVRGPEPPAPISEASLRNIRENARRHNELARAGLSASAARLAGYGDLSIDRIQASMDAQIQRAFAASENRQRADRSSAVHLDDDALVTLISLLRINSQVAKGLLQRLFLNLCEDRATMESTLRILLSLLRAPLSTDEAQSARQEPAQQSRPASLSDALQSGEAMGGAEEPSEQLPLVQLGLLGRGATSVPPAITRRVVELIQHLSKHTVSGAYELMKLRIRTAEAQAALLLGAQDKKGKGKATDEEDANKDSKPGMEVLLELLGKTLCKRSSAHLEAALSCIEVTLSVAKRYALIAEKTKKDVLVSFDEQIDRVRQMRHGLMDTEPSVPQVSAAEALPPASLPASGTAQPDAAGATPGPTEPRPKFAELTKKLLLVGTDQQLLARLPRLLGQSGLSDAAYKRAAHCIRLVALCNEEHKRPMLTELEMILHELAADARAELDKMAAGKASSSAMVDVGVGALGARVLGICEAITALINPKGVKDQTPLVPLQGSMDLLKDKEVDPKDVADLEQLITATEPLWTALGNAIAAIEADLAKSQPNAPQLDAAGPSRIMPPGATQVLPLVKAFFVLCEPRTSHLPPPVSMRRRSSTSVSMDLSLAPVTSEASSSQGGPPDAKPQEAQLPFLRFAERHRRLVNVLIQQNVQLLLEGPLTQLMRAPRLIDFDNKRAFFRSQVRSSSDRYHGSLRIHVRREHLFEDSFHQLRSKTPEEMRGKLSVQFHGEEGIDAGGVTREWYQVMAREMFNPNISLFIPTGGSTFQPNPNSIVQNDEARGTNHLDFFKFVGRVVGKALYDGQLIDAYFTRSFYKHMLGQPLTYQDIEGVDPEYYKNLTWLLEHDMTDVVDLNFVEEVDYFGRVEHVELKPGGRDIKVTNENKREYVDLVAEHRMTTAIRAQIQAFLKGFWEMVPRDLISMFNDHELELLISGLPEIDVDDLRANTEYQGFSPASPVIQYFWEVVRELDREDLALLVQFVTGTSKVPLEGFKALQGIGGPQKFQIHKAYGSQQKLPAAHTCFNQLDLVEYESKELLRERLMLALHEGATGFGFG